MRIPKAISLQSLLKKKAILELNANIKQEIEMLVLLKFDPVSTV